MQRLSIDDHPREGGGRRYVYPVVSRRARGVSVGVNLNPNQACNWRCVYCQVPGLIAGRAPELDLDLLEQELRVLLTDVVRGSFMQEFVPEDMRVLNDVALSGNGEPTSSRQFDAVLERVAGVLAGLELLGTTKVVLITNGSLTHQEHVQAGLRRLATMNGQVWFKLDGATQAAQERLNSTRTPIERKRRNLALCAACCPTWIQTMAVCVDGVPPTPAENDAYVALLRDALAEGVALRGVHLYGLARTSHQPEAERLSPLEPGWLESLAERLRALGLDVRVSP